ncbi:MAG: enoyl-CoA hydratase-related protein [Cyanobacteria bacterium J06649_4]
MNKLENTTVKPVEQLRPPCLVADCQQNILTITLNRPKVLNSIDLEMAEQFLKSLLAAAKNPAVRAIVLTGAGRAFCAGGDLKFAHQVNPETPGDSFLALTSTLHVCVEEIREMSKPVIAAINGPAAGAGLFLALACDLRVMSQSAYLKQSNTSYGLSMPAGGTFMLPRLVGMGRALEIAMLDEPIQARESLELGLVTRVVPDNRLLIETELLAMRVAQMPIETLGRVKRLSNDSFDSTLSEQLAAERQAIAISANSPEGREGVMAFLQKRQPSYI